MKSSTNVNFFLEIMCLQNAQWHGERVGQVHELVTAKTDRTTAAMYVIWRRNKGRAKVKLSLRFYFLTEHHDMKA
jgi:hypothetical protein